MSGNDPRADLSEIADAIGRIAKRIDGIERAAFLADDILRDAVAMQLLVLGEAARRLPQDVRESASLVPLSQIIAMRNRIGTGLRRAELDDRLRHRRPRTAENRARGRCASGGLERAMTGHAFAARSLKSTAVP
jgi:uncharacterized protein with HEPN domain